MAQVIQCPSCKAPYDPAENRCPYCGNYIHAPEVKPSLPQPADEAKLPAWTQGLSVDRQSDGSYDVLEYPPLTLAQAFELLNTLPVPPANVDLGEYAPPTLGYGERSISRNSDGSYFLWPEDKNCDLAEAQNFLKSIYAGW